MQHSTQIVAAILIANLINISPVIAQASHGISVLVKEHTINDAPQDAALVKSPQFAPNFPFESNFEGFVAENFLTISGYFFERHTKRN